MNEWMNCWRPKSMQTILAIYCICSSAFARVLPNTQSHCNVITEISCQLVKWPKVCSTSILTVNCLVSPVQRIDPTFSFWSRVTWQSRYLSGCYLQSVINCGALERATCSVQHLTHSCWVNNVSRDWDTCLQPPPSALITNAPGSSLHLPSSFSHISNQTCTFCPCLETHTEIQTPRHTL